MAWLNQYVSSETVLKVTPANRVINIKYRTTSATLGLLSLFFTCTSPARDVFHPLAGSCATRPGVRFVSSGCRRGGRFSLSTPPLELDGLSASLLLLLLLLCGVSLKAISPRVVSSPAAKFMLGLEDKMGSNGESCALKHKTPFIAVNRSRVTGDKQKRSRASNMSADDSEPPTWARVLYSYTATRDNDISIEKDEVLKVVKKYEGGWWVADKDGHLGVFPASYVTEVPAPDPHGSSPSSASVPPVATTATPTSSSPVPSHAPAGTTFKGQAKAIQDHQAKHVSQLHFQKGDIINIVDKFPTGWWKGEKDGKIGLFPKGFVDEIVDETAKTSKPVSVPTPAPVPAPAATPAPAPVHASRIPANNLGAPAPLVVPILPKPATTALPTPTPAPAATPTPAITHAAPATPATHNTAHAPPTAATNAAHADEDNYERGIAQFDFAGETDSELSFKAGDEIIILNRLDGEWWAGELHGRVGHFPKDYVSVIEGQKTTPRATDHPTQPDHAAAGGEEDMVDMPIIATATVLYDYAGTTASEISTKKGEDINVLERDLPGGWTRASTNDGRIGHIPSSYIQIIELPAVVEKPRSSSNAPPVETKPRASSGASGVASIAAAANAAANAVATTATNGARPSGTQPTPTPIIPKPQPDPKPQDAPTPAPSSTNPFENSTPQPTQTNTPSPAVATTAGATPGRPTSITMAESQDKRKSDAMPKGRVKALYSFEGKTSNELSFKKGDEFVLLKKLEGSWWVGELNGKMGHFPKTYVQEIDSPASPTLPALPQPPTTAGAKKIALPPTPASTQATATATAATPATTSTTNATPASNNVPAKRVTPTPRTLPQPGSTTPSSATSSTTPSSTPPLPSTPSVSSVPFQSLTSTINWGTLSDVPDPVAQAIIQMRTEIDRLRADLAAETKARRDLEAEVDRLKGSSSSGGGSSLKVNLRPTGKSLV
eukprot:TRINITY_DN5374_c0_g1_i1.p1 TRINITY_DN5374_c0_g1~~TRINITY_DN5374_c0_g1_i1.p1  ORF type:complete len:949 (+),score=267.77 TRINITY_DN5374_c0_g1_i1:1229-4075(+)